MNCHFPERMDTEMESWNQNIQKILYKQQVLEFLKAGRQQDSVSSDAYAASITAQCRRKPPTVTRILKISAYIFTVLLLLFCLLMGMIHLLSVLFSNTTFPDSTAMFFAQPSLYWAEIVTPITRILGTPR